MVGKIITSLEFYQAIADDYDGMAQLKNFLPRADLLFDITAPHMGPDIKKILDIGIGTGLSSLPFVREKACTVTGVDGSPDMLAICRRKAIARSLLQVDFEKAVLPFGDGEFNATISANTFYLLSQKAQKEMLKEMPRVTEPGGLVALNYEVRKPGEFGLRWNIASKDPRNPRSVATTSLDPQYIREILAENKLQIVAEDMRSVAKKPDGTPIVFETLVCRKLG